MFSQYPKRVHYDLQDLFQFTDLQTNEDVEKHYENCLQLVAKHPEELDKTFHMNGFTSENKTVSVPMSLYELALLLWPLKYTVRLLKQHPVDPDVIFPNLSYNAVRFHGGSESLGHSRGLAYSEMSARRNIAHFCNTFRHFYDKTNIAVGLWEALVYRVSDYDGQNEPIEESTIQDLDDLLPPFPQKTTILAKQHSYQYKSDLLVLMFTLSNHPQLLEKLGEEDQEKKAWFEKVLIQKNLTQTHLADDDQLKAEPKRLRKI